MQFLHVRKQSNAKMLALLVLGVLIVASIEARVANATPSITLSPTSGPPGTTVTVTGSGFTANGQVQIFMNAAIVVTPTATSAGDITTSFAVPNINPGQYNIAAKDWTTQSVIQMPFTVQQSSTPTPTPSPSPTSKPDLNYTVTIQNERPTIHINLEMANITTTELTLRFKEEAWYVENYASNLAASSDGRSLNVTHTGQGMWTIKQLGSSATFEYDIDKMVPFGYNTPDYSSISVYFNNQGGVIMAPFFFIYPDVTDVNSVTIEFAVPAGWQVVTPYLVEGDHLRVQKTTVSLLIDFLHRQQIYMGTMKVYVERQVDNCTFKLGVLEADKGGDAADSFQTQADVENALNVTINIFENLANLFGENPYDVFIMYSQFRPAPSGPTFPADRYNGNGVNYWPKHRWNELVGHTIYSFMSFDVQIGKTAPLWAREEIAKGVGEMYYGPKLAWKLFNDPVYPGGLYYWYLLYERFYQSDKTSYWEYPVYVKAPFVTLMLDSEIQRLTSGAKSFDDVLKYLYSTYKNTGHSVDWTDIQNAVGAVTGNDLGDLFSRYVYGSEKISYSYVQGFKPHFLEYSKRFAEAFPFEAFPDYDKTIPLFINIEMVVHKDGHILTNSAISAGDNVRNFANYVLSHFTITNLTEKNVEDALSAVTGADCAGFFTRWENSFGRLSLNEVKEWLQIYSDGSSQQPVVPEKAPLVLLVALATVTGAVVIFRKKMTSNKSFTQKGT